ncbi:MAG: sodium:proton antiporter [Halioglobus sp.]|nr:sodium:proton antiporter [Halioglobus sp.]
MAVPELMGQILYLLGAVVVGLLISRLTRLEMTLSCLTAGVLAGLGVSLLDFDTGIRASNIRGLVFYVILPVLIFEAAWNLQPSLLRRWLWPILLLATVGILISTAVMAVLLYLGIGNPAGFPIIAALLTGAILAATDPIAVVAALDRLEAPQDLRTLVEGESMFNDATALVLFGGVLAFASGVGRELDGSFLLEFATAFFGGILLGALVALVAAILVLLLANSAASSLILLATAFATFYIAEHFVHVSGIMALVTAATLCRFLLREQERTFLDGVVHSWDWLGLTFNGLVFVLMGLVITFSMFTEQWLAIALAIPAALVARAVSVFACGLATRGSARSLPLGWQYILVWGGLRGGVAIVLVLSLPTELPYWWTVQSMVFGVVLFTLLVQGTTAPRLIERYGKA